MERDTEMDIKEYNENIKDIISQIEQDINKLKQNNKQRNLIWFLEHFTIYEKQLQASTQTNNPIPQNQTSVM